MSTPTIGCAVLSWNYSAFLDASLKSLAHQTRAPEQVVIADDASTDGSQAIAHAWADPRGWVVLERPERLGMVRNANGAMLNVLTTDLVFALSADDWIEPEFVELHVEALERDESAALAYCPLQYRVTDPGSPRGDLNGAVVGAKEWGGGPIGSNFVSGSAVVRREVFARYGGFPDVAREEDHALWQQMAYDGLRGAYVGSKPLLNYRQHGLGHRNYGDDMRRARP